MPKLRMHGITPPLSRKSFLLVAQLSIGTTLYFIFTCNLYAHTALVCDEFSRILP
jgi:hypothetical protein